jgi:hypothetical protein
LRRPRDPALKQPFDNSLEIAVFGYSASGDERIQKLPVGGSKNKFQGNERHVNSRFKA